MKDLFIKKKDKCDRKDRKTKEEKRKVNSDLRRFKKDSERPDGREREAKKCDMLSVICLTYIDLNQIFLGVSADLWFLKA